MKKNFVLSVLMIGLTFSMIPAFAQTQEVLSVATSESTYEEGETVVISGEVTAIIGETPVTLQIFFESNLIEIAQLAVAQDGSYTHTINAEGPLWGNDGKYTVRASYGVGNIAETTFDFVTEKALSETTNNFEVDAGIALADLRLKRSQGAPMICAFCLPQDPYYENVEPCCLGILIGACTCGVN